MGTTQALNCPARRDRRGSLRRRSRRSQRHSGHGLRPSRGPGLGPGRGPVRELTEGKWGRETASRTHHRRLDFGFGCASPLPLGGRGCPCLHPPWTSRFGHAQRRTRGQCPRRCRPDSVHADRARLRHDTGIVVVRTARARNCGHCEDAAIEGGGARCWGGKGVVRGGRGRVTSGRKADIEEGKRRVRRATDVGLRVRMPSRRQKLDCTRNLSPGLTKLLVYAHDMWVHISFPLLPPSCNMACALRGGPRVEGIPLKCRGMATTTCFWFQRRHIGELDTCQQCLVLHECTPSQNHDGIRHDAKIARPLPPTKTLSRQQQAWDTGLTSWSPAPMLAMYLANLVKRF